MVQILNNILIIPESTESIGALQDIDLQDIAAVFMMVSSLIGTMFFLINKVNSFTNELSQVKKEITKHHEKIQEHENALRNNLDTTNNLTLELSRKLIALETKLEGTQQVLMYNKEEYNALREEIKEIRNTIYKN